MSKEYFIVMFVLFTRCINETFCSAVTSSIGRNRTVVCWLKTTYYYGYYSIIDVFKARTFVNLCLGAYIKFN